MDGVRFNGEEDVTAGGEGEADAKYDDEDVMESVVVEDEDNNGFGDAAHAKRKPRSKQGAALSIKRQQSLTWRRKRGKSGMAANDDEFVPHPFGEGVCREWHFRDDVTEQPYVKVVVEGEDRQADTLTLVAGEGIAIGRQPCEFHGNEFGG